MANENNRPPIPRVHWYDGINPTNTDLQVEQDGELQHVNYVVNDFHGSGILQKNPITLPPILNTTQPNPDNVSYSVLGAGSFDGQGIFVDRQPVDTTYGDQLVISVENVKIPLYSQTKVIIFGKVYDPNLPQGMPVLETLVFDKPGRKATFNYFKSVIAIFFNNFSGGAGRTDLSAASQESLNVSAPEQTGRVTVTEVGPLQVLDHGLVLHQSDAPNLDVRDFITSTITRTFKDELTYVVNTAQNTGYVPVSLTDLNQLPLNTTGLATKPFLDSTTNGVLYGQKVYFATNNLQQLSFALSLADDSDGWSGEFVIGIRPLQTKSINQFANAIDLDPDVNVLFEASFTQNDLLNYGFILSTVPQEIKFNFIGTAIAQPNGILTPNQYYVVTLSRRADISIGKIYIEVGPKELQDSKFTSFNPVTKGWTDDIQTDLWFKTYSAAVRVSAGIAYTNAGKMITLQKTTQATDGSIVSAIAGPYPLAVVNAIASDNIVVLQSTELFNEPGEHPRTGNLVYLRIVDHATISVLSTDDFNTLVQATNDANQSELPVVLAVVNDLNNRTNISYTGAITLPGQVRKDQIILFNTGIPDDILEINNIITPNNATTGVRYRIVEARSTTQYLGDFNNDKIFTSFDLVTQAQIQNTFSAQSTNTAEGTSFDPFSIFDTRSRDILGFGARDIEEFILSDIDGYLTINSIDVARLQYLTTTLPAFVTPPPTSTTIQVLTLENITSRDNALLIAQKNGIGVDGYAAAIFPDQIKFTALNVSDMRALSEGDKVFLSADGYTNVDGTFSDPAYSNLTLKKFIQRNDLLIETRFQSNVIPTVDTAYVLSFYDQNPVFDNKLGIFGEVATEVLEFVVPGIDLLAADIVAGDKVEISSDTLAQSRAGTYTISEVIDAVTFRVTAPITPIPPGLATAGIEIFASDGVTPKLQDIAVVEFTLTGLTPGLIASGINPGDRLHVSAGPVALNGVYTVSRVLSSTILTIVPPLTALTADATTILTNTLNIIDTTAFVADTSNFPTSGTLLVDSEQITYTGTTSISFTGLTRGVNSTAPALHNINAVMSESFSATFQVNDSTDIVVKIVPTPLTGALIGSGPVFPDIETLAPASLPNGVDAVFEFSLTHVPVTGTVNVHWITGGVMKTMSFDAAPVQITGDGNPQNSSIDRITGTIVLDTFLPPDADTAITSDYRVAPIVTLKRCIPTVVNAVSPTQTDIEFKVPFINPIPEIDITGIALCPYVIIQTNNADPPAIILDGASHVVAGAVMPNTINLTASDGYIVPSRNMVLQVVDSAGNVPNLANGSSYFMQIYSGSRVNLPAAQKEFLSDILSLSSLVNWTVQKNNFEWLPSDMNIEDYRRFLPTSFVTKNTVEGQFGSVNEMWVPADLYVGRGEILSAPGVPYHGDLEVTKLNLDLPVTALLSNNINIYNNLIATFEPSPGITRGGRKAMRFSDGSYVGEDDFGNDTALTRNQVRVMPALGSLYLDGYQVPNAPVYTDLDEVLTKLHYEIRMGMYYDDLNGVLYFHAENIKAIFDQEPIVQTGVCRIVVDVALKKSGFINPVVNVNTTDILRLFTNPVDITPTPKYSISGEIVAGFTVGKSTNPDG